jgi:hypothetical protein
MHSLMIQPSGSSAGGQATTPATAEGQVLDAQLELAAKKAALRELEAQAAGGPASVPTAPLPPGASRTTVVMEKDGKTTILENPTAEQLRQLGISSRGAEWNLLGRLEPRQIMGLSVFALMATVGITWLLLHYLRGGRSTAQSGVSTDLNARMVRIESAVESVAVEVERISEGQRYAARMLAEGAAVPVAVPERGEAIPQQRMERKP